VASRDNSNTSIRAIAFHLPQFHPIPENDEWWGKGFTEWTNVVKARPLFPGHHQPHLPADLGFYDLRLPDSRAAQAELAASYGIHGFCYYHYWFNGQRLLGRPLDEILGSGEPDFPFCLCWANESWTRGWLGQEREVLISQTYNPDDELMHARWLAKAFADSRYLRKDGRAIFLVYRPGNLPEPKRLTETLRTACNRNGDKDPYLIGVDAHRVQDFRNDGFDATLAFEPALGRLPRAFDDAFRLRRLWRNLRLGVMSGRLKVYDYTEARQRMLSLVRPFPTIPCVFVGWDNTPRRGPKGLIVVNSSPQAFGNALEAECAKLRASGDCDPILFINAWNEWAEGNHLEPCQRWGHKHLEMIRNVLAMNGRVSDTLPIPATYNRSEMGSHAKASYEPSHSIGPSSNPFPGTMTSGEMVSLNEPAKQSKDTRSSEDVIRAIAFHLPQFHPIPENDEWWGKGFTEWTNVVKARPLFPGHYQPHLPADLGFYDLRLPEARAAQAELASSYGIYGFCFYHYWFNGRQLLERPVNEIWQSGQPDFPFCLCWANENWTRQWDGSEGHVLLEQHYCEADDLAHIRALIPLFFDRRYIRVEDRPLFLVYQALRLPNPRETTAAWRREAERAGLKGLFLVRVESGGNEEDDPRNMGFDSSLEFQPRWPVVWSFQIRRRKWWHRRRLGTAERAFYKSVVCEYDDLVGGALSNLFPGYPRIPCVCPGWDNSARRKQGAAILINSTPEKYERWLREVINRQRAKIQSGESATISANSLVFINAWNEWAEGNHLEPCQKWGREYLEATRRALSLYQSEFRIYEPLAR
jgi:lipopolysaccharide biosynthesis protein